jgi:hypothetical protein
MVSWQRQQLDTFEGDALTGLEAADAADPGIAPIALVALRKEERGVRASGMTAFE